MKQEFVNHKGEPINWAGSSFKAKAKATREVEPKSLGFRVVGYPAGAIDAARVETNALHARGASKPWDESSWLRRNKPQRISGRNYELREAAEKFAELAKGQGWERVAVQEVTRGDVEGARRQLLQER